MSLGSIVGRITEFEYPYYRVDFTRHNNDWDSDDEQDEWQWSHSVRFSYQRVSNEMLFQNTDEIPYNTLERYTGRTFWATDSTSIIRLLRDTFAIRKARGEALPPWPLSAVTAAADLAWDNYRSES